MSKVITRFAPSPTGYLHIGGARTALFAWLYAKSYGGDCLLRIEDTDKERSEDKYTHEIINSFRWLGINFDQDVVYQSHNANRYNEMIDSLLETGGAYVCPGNDTDDDKKFREKDLQRGSNTVVRFKMPTEGYTTFNDLVKGELQVSNDQLDDFIIERSDGSATYNFCVVVDDIDSEISHVIRGDDHVNNTFKQINVFKALNAKIPEYGHVPMILGEDGKRLSKRHGALGVGEYAELGILPQALKNYLLRLGWSKGDEEIFTDQEMQVDFKGGTLNQSPATFSMDKLLWFNKHYLDQMTVDQLNDLINVTPFDGGAFANTIVNVARRGNPNTIPSAMITGLITDAYGDMTKEFIPQVIKEMSTISVGGNLLSSYDIVLKDFKSKEVRNLRRKLDQGQSDDFRYISYDNSVPSIVTIRVRYSDKVERLADKVMGLLDDSGVNSKEPIVAPDLTDLIFSRLPDDE